MASVQQQRRRLAIGGVAAAVVAPVLLLGTRGAQGQAQPLRLTPAQTEGPFYPLDWNGDIDADLMRRGDQGYERGQPAWVEGRVTDEQGQAVRGAVVEIWQCDAEGHYHHPGDGGQADPRFQGRGRVSVDAEGRYRFRTLRPSPYDGRTPHIHFKVRLGRRDLLTTQLYVEGDPGNERDGLWRRLRDPLDRAALTVPFKPDGGALRAEFPLVVRA
jgi:protocatechuate 3,4-dioxygenase, beta subunit